MANARLAPEAADREYFPASRSSLTASCFDTSLSISLSKGKAQSRREIWQYGVAGRSRKKLQGRKLCYDVGRGFAEALKRFYAAFQLHRYARISTVSGLSRKLLQALNRIGQFEMATICGSSASMVM